MNDKILEFIRVLRKMLQFPEIPISEAETEIIKEEVAIRLFCFDTGQEI